MPHDKNGTVLNAGDRVVIPAFVKDLTMNDEYCNVTIETEEPMHPSPTKTLITLNTRQLIAQAAAVLLMLFALAFAPLAKATDTNAPVLTGASSTLWDFVTTGSNYWVAPYGTFGTSSHTAGGGIAVGYQVSPIINPVVRLDYFDGSFWMPSLTAQLQPPRQLMGKIPIIPFGIAGIATPIAGAGTGNGTLVTVLGAGAAVKLDFLGSSKLLQHTDLVVDYEKWLGLPQKEQNQIRFGVLFKF